jgi:hypothetical protein
MSEFKITINLSLSAEEILRKTDWKSENPNLSIESCSEFILIDMIRTGLIAKWEDGIYQLTDIGEDILNQLQ